MQKRVLFAALAALSIGGAVKADEASFVQGFANVCNQFTIFGLGGSMEAFVGYGWDIYPGADLGEYEAYKNGTAAIVATSATGRQPSCTIMDETVSMAFARDLLERTLDLNFSTVVKGTGYNGGEVWRALTEKGTLIYSVQEAMGGTGAAISFELRP